MHGYSGLDFAYPGDQLKSPAWISQDEKSTGCAAGDFLPNELDCCRHELTSLNCSMFDATHSCPMQAGKNDSLCSSGRASIPTGHFISVLTLAQVTSEFFSGPLAA